MTATTSPMESHMRLPVMKLPGIRFDSLTGEYSTDDHSDQTDGDEGDAPACAVHFAQPTPDPSRSLESATDCFHHTPVTKSP